MERLPSLTDDGLITPDVGEWAEEKYQLVRCYATIFANAMSGKWPALTYVDLFAGAGRARLRDTNRVVAASPSIVIDIPTPFSRYIFCEVDEERSSALEARSQRADRDVKVIRGDCNEEVDRIVGLIPSLSLTFCFVDPFNIRSLRFETIQKLASKRIDFLMLLASGMDANRNPAEYLKPADTTVEVFTGSADWRTRWSSGGSRLNFGDFVADEFGKAMKKLSYAYEGLSSTKNIVNEKNVRLYRLAFFSKHPLGSKFWDQCKKYTNPQRGLF